jgi:DNA-binding transcriptional LysR family regulator
LGAARDGLGIAYVPEATARPSIADGRLVPLLEGWRGIELKYFLYYSSHRQMPPPLQAFIAFIHKHANGIAKKEMKGDKRALQERPLEAAE